MLIQEKPRRTLPTADDVEAASTRIADEIITTPLHISERLSSATGAQVYLTSVNGAAETGELINIDGTGNRVASGLFGHEKVYFIVGRNKVAPDYDAALWRARNIAAPKNAQRLGRNTPCAAKGDRCYDCKSPERICRALVVYWEKPGSMDMEVVLVDEDLGY